MTRINKWDKEAIVRAIMEDVPKPDKKKRREEIQAAVVKRMTPECRKVYKAMPDALREFYAGDICYDGVSYATRTIVRGDVSEKDMEDILSTYKAQDEAVFTARRQLQGAIEACTSIKQLNDRLPEFKKYFPTVEKPTANLPALANVVADLSKLGWPKK